MKNHSLHCKLAICTRQGDFTTESFQKTSVLLLRLIPFSLNTISPARNSLFRVLQVHCSWCKNEFECKRQAFNKSLLNYFTHVTCSKVNITPVKLGWVFYSFLFDTELSWKSTGHGDISVISYNQHHCLRQFELTWKKSWQNSRFTRSGNISTSNSTPNCNACVHW